ncbi:hypothetical protein J3458_004623 [Metarhizium acridum]|uniref:uncharacterized protein n=1 Tax=Metarhizium acridum TaxID=92637 RepID=UPI001C6BEFA9|nr:hypothetical protein J3458_004623 [Metarhizium acridum]
MAPSIFPDKDAFIMVSIKNVNENTGSSKSPKHLHPCIAATSLGSPTRSLETKLRAAASKGLSRVELYWADLLHFSFSFASQTSADTERLSMSKQSSKLASSNGFERLVRAFPMSRMSVLQIADAELTASPADRRPSIAERGRVGAANGMESEYRAISV